MKYTFGPVLSRRLGRSLGVDPVPFKTCTYDCIYCELGRTDFKSVDRKEFVPPGVILEEVETYLNKAGEDPDYITLAGSGEPTLYSRIEELIHGIKKLSKAPVAILTNGSLLTRPDVRDELMKADLVIPSLDAAREKDFSLVNRPHPSLHIGEVIQGMEDFRRSFQGEIWIEVLLCRSFNDGSKELESLAEAIGRISPDRIQLNTVVRPPAEDFAYTLSDDQMKAALKYFGKNAEVIAFTAPGRQRGSPTSRDEAAVLDIIRRRPLTSEDIARQLDRHPAEVIKCLDSLSQNKRVKVQIYESKLYYIGDQDHANL